jgi:hypothetical protein
LHPVGGCLDSHFAVFFSFSLFCANIWEIPVLILSIV